MNINKIFAQTGIHMKNMIKTIGELDGNPRCTNADGSVRYVKPGDWTSGFFPGCLWLQYEYTGDSFWKDAAVKYTEKLKEQQFNDTNHDIGFKMYCSYGAGLRLSDKVAYKDVLLQSAKTLISRYNPVTGCIRSWNHHKDKWGFPVIIDNMMNLELLFWASKESGDSTYYDIALSHAEKTLDNHFRADNSCYHVLDYNTLTGAVEHKHTRQGHAHESAWARGQAWAIYGFTMCYRETGFRKFLDQAVKVADFIMNHNRLPEDGVPFWDFDDPKIPHAPRDASSAAAICSGLYELNTYLGESGKKYRVFADKLFQALSSPEYLAGTGENNNFILKHSVGNLPQNDEVDQPIIYADYYYLEAALRKNKLETGS
ncbi:MAG: glycoside hydrolase family 88 protein [Spirochaetaceae bacterium]